MPFEMITMLGSSLLGGFMSIWGQSIKAKQEEQKEEEPKKNPISDELKSEYEALFSEMKKILDQKMSPLDQN